MSNFEIGIFPFSFACIFIVEFMQLGRQAKLEFEILKIKEVLRLMDDNEK